MELTAPARWQCVDFVSDLHLQSSELATSDAFGNYLQSTTADAVFILGDLFEVWVGDDVLTVADGFERRWAGHFRLASTRLDLFLMRGNRDFLMGPAFAAACKTSLLEDPCVLTYAGQRWLLTHGDAWCLADVEYMAFREQVRSPAWQTNFLQQPLDVRTDLARAMRARSEDRKRSKADYADVDSAKALELLQQANASHMVHGHTHRPGRHSMDGKTERWVLSDWECGAKPPRAQVLRVRSRVRHGASSFTVERIPPGMAGNHGQITAKTAD